MTRRTLRELSAWLGGAMEPGELQRFEEKLAADPDLARRANQMRAAESRPPPLWSLPPPGLFGGPSPFGAHVEQALSMGAEQVPVGLTRVRFHPPDAMNRAVVVLARARGGWDVLFPGPDDDPLFVHELTQLDSGERELQLATIDPDSRALALALPTPGLLPRRPPGRDGWAALREAIAEDLVPVRTLALSGPGIFSG